MRLSAKVCLIYFSHFRFFLWSTKATTLGFDKGNGGLITLPVVLPTNFTNVILFQMRMIAVIMSYKLKGDQVQTFVYATLAGASVSNIVKKSGIVIGNKMMFA